MYDSCFWPEGHWWRVHKSSRFFLLSFVAPLLAAPRTLCNTSSFLACVCTCCPVFLPSRSFQRLRSDSHPRRTSPPVEVRAQTRTPILTRPAAWVGWWCRARKNRFDGLWAIILTHMSKALLTSLLVPLPRPPNHLFPSSRVLPWAPWGNTAAGAELLGRMGAKRAHLI